LPVYLMEVSKEALRTRRTVASVVDELDCRAKLLSMWPLAGATSIGKGKK